MIDKLLEAARASTWPRLYLLILMALTTGARRSELLGLRWPDVDLERRVARVATTKNSDPRMLPLPRAVIAELLRFSAEAGLLFPGTRDATVPYYFHKPFINALRAAGLEDVTFHTLRHSCASVLARNGATLIEIGDLLGHRQLQMTKRYSHLATAHKAALVDRVLGDLGQRGEPQRGASSPPA
jgi:integrase